MKRKKHQKWIPPKLKAPESYYYFIYQSQNIFKYVSLNIYVKLKPLASLFPFSSLPHTNTDSIHKTHFDYPGWEYPRNKVCICLHAIPKSLYWKEAFSIAMTPLFIKTETHTESMLSGFEGGGGCLFAVCLYSNMSFMQSFTETLCVVHFGPVCRADGRGGCVVVFLTSFFNIGQCCL